MRITSYCLFYVGLILRFTDGSSTDNLIAAKILLAYDLVMWFIRSMGFLSIAEEVGAKLVMIRRMVNRISFTFSHHLLRELLHSGCRRLLFHIHPFNRYDGIWYSFPHYDQGYNGYSKQNYRIQCSFNILQHYLSSILSNRRLR